MVSGDTIAGDFVAPQSVWGDCNEWSFEAAVTDDNMFGTFEFASDPAVCNIGAQVTLSVIDASFWLRRVKP